MMVAGRTAPRPVARWARIDLAGNETSAPSSWLNGEHRLRSYLRAAAEAIDDQLSFYWSDQGRRLFKVELVVTTVSPGTTRSVELFLTPAEAPYQLTFRELETLTLVAGGLTNPEISARLGTTRRTVATHIEHLFQKMNVSSRAAAAALAVSEHLLVLPIPGGLTVLAPLGVQRLEAAASRTSETDRQRPSRYRDLPPRKHPIVIGGIYPSSSGPAAADGRGRRKSTEMAIDEINRRGGIGGRALVHFPVESDVADSESFQASLYALVQNGVHAITFGYTLARDDFETMFTDAAEYGCPVLHSATSASAQQVVVNDPMRFGNVFQVCAPEDRYGTGFVRTLDQLSASGAWRPRNRHILVIDSTDPHLTTFTPKAFELGDQQGWKITTEYVDFVSPDWRSVLRQLTELEPAAVMVSTWIEQSLIDFLGNVHSAGSPPLIYAIYAPSVPGFVKRAGPLAEGLLWATVIGLYQDTWAGEFTRDFSHVHHGEPGRSGSGIHYDMVNLLGEAWGHVADPYDFAAVTQRMRRIVHRGVSGAYYLGTPGQSALTYPDDTLDASIAQAHLVHQIQSGRHVIIAPEPYTTGTFRGSRRPLPL